MTSIALLVSAWIEISVSTTDDSTFDIALLVSAWIEIYHRREKSICLAIALLVSAWIEILFGEADVPKSSTSHSL